MAEDELKVSVIQLEPSLFQAWAKKQGGSVKNWKKRWCVLKPDRLWYFKAKNSTFAQGYIELTESTEIQEEPELNVPGKKFFFSINSRNQKGSRKFMFCVENEVYLREFMKRIEEVIEKLKPQKIEKKEEVIEEKPKIEEVKPQTPTIQPKEEVKIQQPEKPVQPPAPKKKAGWVITRPTMNRQILETRNQEIDEQARIQQELEDMKRLEEEKRMERFRKDQDDYMRMKEEEERRMFERTIQCKLDDDDDNDYEEQMRIEREEMEKRRQLEEEENERMREEQRLKQEQLEQEQRRLEEERIERELIEREKEIQRQMEIERQQQEEEEMRRIEEERRREEEEEMRQLQEEEREEQRRREEEELAELRRKQEEQRRREEEEFRLLQEEEERREKEELMRRMQEIVQNEDDDEENDSSSTSDFGEGEEQTLENVASFVQAFEWLDENNQEFIQLFYNNIPRSSPTHLAATVNATGTEIFIRCSSPLSELQAVIEFFNQVGSPEDQIEKMKSEARRNGVLSIETWISLSNLGGCDAGWNIIAEQDSLNVIKEISDPSDIDSAGMITKWCEENNIQFVHRFGRDMGEYPPHNTEFWVDIPSNETNRLETAAQALNFPPIPPEVIEGCKGNRVMLKIVTNEEGFVKFSIVIEKIKADAIRDCIESLGEDATNVLNLKDLLNIKIEGFEYCFLNEGYGYEVYTEGKKTSVIYSLGTF